MNALSCLAYSRDVAILSSLKTCPHAIVRATAGQAGAHSLLSADTMSAPVNRHRSQQG